MDLVMPEFGLFFWTLVVFSLLLIVLRKYAWGPILKSVDQRNKNIKDALKEAEKAREEMKSLTADNEQILMEAKKERDVLLKEAREIKEEIISNAKDSANKESEKIIEKAKDQIENEKMKAVTELKNNVAQLTIDIATKVIKTELSDESKQKTFIDSELKKSNLN